MTCSPVMTWSRNACDTRRASGHDPGEHLPEGSGIGVADLPCHLVSGERILLEQLPGAANAQALRTVGRGEAGGFLQSPKERALLQSRLLDESRKVEVPTREGAPEADVLLSARSGERGSVLIWWTCGWSGSAMIAAGADILHDRPSPSQIEAEAKRTSSVC